MQIKGHYSQSVAAVVDDHNCMPVREAAVEGAVTSASGRMFQSLMVAG